jgi:hypothetical protein
MTSLINSLKEDKNIPNSEKKTIKKENELENVNNCINKKKKYYNKKNYNKDKYNNKTKNNSNKKFNDKLSKDKSKMETHKLRKSKDYIPFNKKGKNFGFRKKYFEEKDYSTLLNSVLQFMFNNIKNNSKLDSNERDNIYFLLNIILIFIRDLSKNKFSVSEDINLDDFKKLLSSDLKTYRKGESLIELELINIIKKIKEQRINIKTIPNFKKPQFNYEDRL